jgi:hypothetical protein
VTKSGHTGLLQNDKLRPEFRRLPADRWGQCYDQNFLLFSTIFGEKKLAFFSKTNVMVKFLDNLALFFSQKRPFFRHFFGRKYCENNCIGPWWRPLRRKKNFLALADGLGCHDEEVQGALGSIL